MHEGVVSTWVQTQDTNQYRVCYGEKDLEYHRPLSQRTRSQDPGGRKGWQQHTARTNATPVNNAPKMLVHVYVVFNYRETT